MRILRKGSCIAIDIPPITLTPSRTAAERQLIGEESEIEPDGWLIASAQYTRSNLAESDILRTELQAGRRYYIELGTLDFYRENVLHYRALGILGESIEGLLLPVPRNVLPNADRRKYTEERRVATEVAREVNAARVYLLDFKSRQLARQADLEEKLALLRRQYYQDVRVGEWVRNEKRRWVRVR